MKTHLFENIFTKMYRIPWITYRSMVKNCLDLPAIKQPNISMLLTYYVSKLLIKTKKKSKISRWLYGRRKIENKKFRVS